MIKKVKCNICNHRFYIEKSKVKQVLESSSLVDNLTKGTKTYDAIDCPNCGCQKVLWVRLPEREVQNNDTRRK